MIFAQVKRADIRITNRQNLTLIFEIAFPLFGIRVTTWCTSPFFRHPFRRVAYIRGLSGWRGPPTPARERSPALALATSSSTASALSSLTAFEYPLQISKLLGKDIRLGLERSFEFFERHWRRSQDEAIDADVGFDPD